MNIYSFLSSIAFLLYLYIGLMSIRRSPRLRANLLFSIFAFLYSLWSFEYAFMSSAQNKEIVWTWARIFSFCYTVSAPVFLHFALHLTGKHKLLKLPVLIPVYLPGFLFMVKGWSKDFLFSDFVKHNGIWLEVNNLHSAWGDMYSIYYYLCIITGLALIVRWGKRSNLLKERRQARLISMGFFLTLVLITINAFGQHIYGLISFPRVPHLMTLVWLATTSYAMRHYDFLGATPISAAKNKFWKSLSEREQEIVSLLIEGLTYKDIAVQLHISNHTVKSHIERIYQKTQVSSRAQLTNLLLPPKI